MTPEHEHAIAIIKAHGEGKVVQLQWRDGMWRDWNSRGVPAVTDALYEWRIKPEPRETNTELRQTIIQLRDWAALAATPAPAAQGAEGGEANAKHPAGTPMMPAGTFFDGCWKSLPSDVCHHGRMLTQSWRAADSTELKRALEAGVLALARPQPEDGGEAVAWVSYTDPRAPICLRVSKRVYTEGLEVYSDIPCFEGEIPLRPAPPAGEREAVEIAKAAWSKYWDDQSTLCVGCGGGNSPCDDCGGTGKVHADGDINGALRAVIAALASQPPGGGA
jgi:hypothetical protein